MHQRPAEPVRQPVFVEVRLKYDGELRRLHVLGLHPWKTGGDDELEIERREPVEALDRSQGYPRGYRIRLWSFLYAREHGGGARLPGGRSGRVVAPERRASSASVVALWEGSPVSPSTNPDSVHMVELEAHRRHVAIALITTLVPSFMLVGLFLVSGQAFWLAPIVMFALVGALNYFLFESRPGAAQGSARARRASG